MSRPARLWRDVDALTGNLAVARARAPAARVYGVVKANAYGHGAPWAGAGLLAAGADALAVACLEEARQLRESGVSAPLLLLEGAVDPAETSEAARLGLDLVIHTPEQFEPLVAHAPYGPRLWLKVDTGMHRLGFAPDDCFDAWQRLCGLCAGGEAGLMTHFASADEAGNPSTASQLAAFRDLIPALGATRTSVANSAAVLGLTGLDSLSAETWIRPGLMLYGATPFGEQSAAASGLAPVGRFETALIAIQQVKAGEAVGYGATWRAPRDGRIGIAAAGYADGYPRHMAPGSEVLVNNRRAPLAGRVSMDMLAVSLAGHDEARIGDPVTLWGAGLPVEEVAAAAGTIAYDLMCRPAPRVRRLEFSR